MPQGTGSRRYLSVPRGELSLPHDLAVSAAIFDVASLVDAVDAQATYLGEAGFSEATAASYRGHALRFVRWLNREYRSAVGPDVEGQFRRRHGPWSVETLMREGDRYGRYLAATGLAPHTVTQYQLGATSFLSYLAISGRAVARVQGSAGECRLQAPYQPLSPILDDAGLRYCCSHKPQSHCSEPVAPLQPGR